MKAIVGNHYYEPRFNSWNVYIWDAVNGGNETAHKVCDFCTKAQAAAYVYEKNGWTKKY
jgi:hypothetical protein